MLMPGPSNRVQPALARGNRVIAFRLSRLSASP
jgi:hypothetical protein